MLSGYDKLNQAILGFNDAVDAHYAWIIDMFYMLNDGSEEKNKVVAEDSHHICHFGLWLGSMRTDYPEDYGYLLRIEDRHKSFHDACRAFVLAHGSGKPGPDGPDALKREISGFMQELNQYRAHLLQKRVGFDMLTGLPSRRTLDESFKHISHDHRQGSLFLYLIDVDHFKYVNDQYGHLVGDEVLKVVAKRLQNSLRANDSVYRYGGEEFVLIAHAENIKAACCFGGRLNSIFADAPVIVGEQIIDVRVTLSVVEFTSHDEIHSVLKRADEGLYHGKNSGRNRCVFVEKENAFDIFEIKKTLTDDGVIPLIQVHDLGIKTRVCPQQAAEYTEHLTYR